MKGEDDVKFADVVNGDQGMTMMVVLGGGSSTRMEIPFIIFQNKNSSYSMIGFQDDVLGVLYRTEPKEWIYTRVFGEWLCEKRVIS